MPPSSLFQALSTHNPLSPAITHAGLTHTYASLLTHTANLRSTIASRLPASPANPIAIFHNPSYPYIPSLLAAWASNRPALPLSPLYPLPALSPLLSHSSPSLILTSPSSPSISTTIPSLSVTAPSPHSPRQNINYHAISQSLHHSSSDQLLVLYTSGTTGPSKAVVWTRDMLNHQLQSLSTAWKWSPTDTILNVLPLHHVHGIVNIVLSALYNGAHIQLHHTFNPSAVWAAFSSQTSPPTVFMAVPAVYKKLIMYYNAQDNSTKSTMRLAAHKLRLFVSGSAPLPKSDFQAWQHISGQTILERYGMTEIGMALSNSYHDRRQGMLGKPLPGVEVALADDGELLVRSPSVFAGYWKRPDLNHCFTSDAYFRTGDIVEEERGMYRMLGRASSDIIKTGGFKVSAIEIEDVLRDCPGVNDCCVVGVHDDVLGEVIVAAVEGGPDIVTDHVLQFANQNLPRYKVPRQVLAVDQLPRNVLGKVQKAIFKKSLV